MKLNRSENWLKSESGYASFVITLVTMIVVSLIVVAFASDARLEQKNSLANALATQAYYAAESGINDAYNIISTDLKNNVSPLPSTGNRCAKGGPFINNGSNSLSNSSQVQYSCLIVNTEPNSLAYQDVEPGQGEVIELSSANGANVNNFTISWQYYQSTVNGSALTFSGCPALASGRANLPTLSAAPPNSYLPHDCGAPPLQIDAIGNTSLLSNQNATATTILLQPEQNSGQASNVLDTTISADAVFYVDCNATPASGSAYACTATINAFNIYPTVYIHLLPFYQPANVVVTAKDSSGITLNLSNDQVVIDSTGEAGGQLKRLQERVCVSRYCDSAAPAGAIQSTECIDKQFTVFPGDSKTTPTAPANC